MTAACATEHMATPVITATGSLERTRAKARAIVVAEAVRVARIIIMISVPSWVTHRC